MLFYIAKIMATA